jgi:lipopolysaccharide export system protein LptA
MMAQQHNSGSMRWRMGLIGVAASVIILLLLIMADWTGTASVEQSDTPVTELIGPAELNTNSSTAGGLMDPNMSVSLPKGGWLQVADDTGRLAQQYRFTHLDPNPKDLPAHWIELRSPVVELYMGGGRLVVLSGKEAVAYAPRRALEEGRLLGDVVIHMFEPVLGGYADPTRDDPAMTITTQAAGFDNLSGRISCSGALKIVTPTEEMAGRDLQILLNDRDDRIEYLEITQIDYLLLRDVQAVGAMPTTSQWPRPQRRIHKASGRPHVARRVIPVAATAPASPPFYTLTLHDNVRITQAPAANAPAGHTRLVRADILKVIFSFESQAFNTTSPPASAYLREPLGTRGFLAAAAIGAVPPKPGPEEVLVTCTGLLTMVPLEKADQQPPRPQDMRLELIGAPVRVIDPAQNTTATCDQIIWRSQSERFDLTAAAPRNVIITSPEITIESRHTWARPDAGLAGIEGSGRATLVSSTPTTQQAGQTAVGPATEARTTITWDGLVNMRFDQAASRGTRGLQSLHFQRGVEVLSPDGTLTADTLEMQFEPDASGDAIPDRLTGTGGIRAASDEQVLWADDIVATLGPSDEKGGQDDSKAIEVRDVHATGDVQVLMADGARVWADALHGDAAQETIDLTGHDLVVARGEVVIEHGTSLQVKRLEGVADWPGAGRAIMLATQPNVATDARIARPTTPKTRGELDSEITWHTSVHIEFDPSADDQDAAMRSITFDGDVAMESPDGTMDTGSLEMHFTPDATGKATPDRLICHRRVRAHNEDQTLWADDLVATLEPLGEAVAGEQDGPMDRITIRDVLATGNVQVLMKDNARAFADRLEGDAKQETVVLTGEDVMIARPDTVIDRGHYLRIDRLAGTADWEGSGRSRMLAEPISLAAASRIPPPRILGNAGDPRVTMRTLWKTSLHYDTKFADGAGAMDILGNVDIVVDRSDLQRSSLQGQSVRLEFAGLTDPDPTTIANDNLFQSGARVLHRLIAKGDARLESRTWETASRLQLPRVFFVGAKHITWDDIQTEAQVIGDGNIVIREPEWATSGSKKSGGPFSGPGTSRFVWSERLDLVHEADDRFRLTMTGDVEVLWKSALNSRDVATLTSEEVHVLTRRGVADATVSPGTPLQLGSDMEVDRLRAIGRVYLTTSTRRADCHMLDYNTRTKMAELVARAGRTVSLVTQGSPMPVQATRMIWNMDPAIDTITLEQPRGGGAQ